MPLKQHGMIIEMVLAVGAMLAVAAGPAADLVTDGDFQRSDLVLGTRDEPAVWVVRNHGAEQASIEIVAGADGSRERFLRYRNSGEGSHNIHVDQLVRVTPGTVYEVRARVRGDGKLEPMIAVQTKAWANLVTSSCGRSTDWHSIRLLFHSFDNKVVRFEWFPGANGRIHTGVAGTSWLDDVSIRPVSNPAPSLLRSFTLQRPQPDQKANCKPYLSVHRATLCHCGESPLGTASCTMQMERRLPCGA